MPEQQMTATEIVATEQILISLMKQANAELQEAITRLEKKIPGSVDYNEFSDEIVDYRTNVLGKIQAKMSELNKSMKGDICGIDSEYVNYVWKH